MHLFCKVFCQCAKSIVDGTNCDISVACIFLKSAFPNSEEYDPDYEYFHYLNSKVYMTLLE